MDPEAQAVGETEGTDVAQDVGLCVALLNKGGEGEGVTESVPAKLAVPEAHDVVVVKPVGVWIEEPEGEELSDTTERVGEAEAQALAHELGEGEADDSKGGETDETGEVEPL